MDGAGPGLLDSIWRYRWYVVVVTLAVFALSTGLGFLRDGQAQAEATVALTAPSSLNVLSPGLQGDAALARYTSQRALFVRSDDVLGTAAERLPGTTIEGLRAAITVTPAATSTSLLLSARATTPEDAVAVVGIVVDAYREETREQVEQRTQAAITSLDADATKLRRILADPTTAAAAQAAATTLSSVTRQTTELQADSAVFADGVDFVAAATRDSAVTPGLPIKNMAVGLLLGLVLASTLAWLRADRDRRLSDSREAEVLLGVPMLLELPQVNQPVPFPAEKSEITRHCREIIAPLLDGNPRVVLLVTGVERKSGATTIALGAAAAAAAEGLRVLVIDGDLHSKGLSSMLHLPPRAGGLVEAASGDNSWSSYVDVEVGAGLKISALPAGDNPSGDWGVTAAGLQAMVHRLRPQFHVIVIDAPLQGGEYVSAVLAGLVDGVILVVRRDARVNALGELRQFLTSNKASVLGYVFNFARHSKRRFK